MLKKIFILLSVLILLTACDTISSTGDSAADPEAAGNYLPNIATYSATNADSMVDALTAAAGGASLASGNPALAALVAKIDDMIQCYQDVGAVAANIYTPSSVDILGGRIPSAGAVAVINQDRLADNFLACALGQRGMTESVSAQSAELEPCAGSGEFTINDDTFSYIYAATDTPLCATFEQHFANIRANQGN